MRKISAALEELRNSHDTGFCRVRGDAGLAMEVVPEGDPPLREHASISARLLVTERLRGGSRFGNRRRKHAIKEDWIPRAKRVDREAAKKVERQMVRSRAERVADQIA